jgi:hypothetical protein
MAKHIRRVEVKKYKGGNTRAIIVKVGRNPSEIYRVIWEGNSSKINNIILVLFSTVPNVINYKVSRYKVYLRLLVRISQV